MPLQIVRNDITRMRVDAIVNAANERLLQGGGVCGAIFAAAGSRELQAACNAIGHCNTGESVATPAFALPAKHVIHTVGPVWHGGANNEEALLASCYRTALALAVELKDNSIAFPLVSSGIYGYPKGQAIDVALAQIRAFLNNHDMDVYLTIFDAEATALIRSRYPLLRELVDDTYVRKSSYAERKSWERTGDTSAMSPAPQGVAAANASMRMDNAMPVAAPSAQGVKGTRRQGPLARLLQNLDKSFSETLLSMIDERGLKDSDVYKRANMSRQHFSKMRNNRHYKPKKHTVLALAVAMELSLDETKTLLERAGFALTHASERDVIVEYFISRGAYDIHEINLALYAFDQPLLG